MCLVNDVCLSVYTKASYFISQGSNVWCYIKHERPSYRPHGSDFSLAVFKKIQPSTNDNSVCKILAVVSDGYRNLKENDISSVILFRALYWHAHTANYPGSARVSVPLRTLPYSNCKLYVIMYMPWICRFCTYAPPSCKPCTYCNIIHEVKNIYIYDALA